MEQALQGFPGNINAMTLTLLDNVNYKNEKGLIKGLILEALADGNSACPSWACRDNVIKQFFKDLGAHVAKLNSTQLNSTQNLTDYNSVKPVDVADTLDVVDAVNFVSI